ncbi:hypothetical protein PILCRDRAFT_824622 [Piloderma croceum F 1598]|uniref:Ricin B lectin domain-containing protein n=1 Tax=Piloderma croceum (strain F 1598) TaxID=765440 RepID=A0A0C3FE46_PILCF|nr:hypothetical protein PILCRDRAFT_824622 [Piloderma croceum F 1598]
MFTNAVSVPRASSGKCHTIATGYLSTLTSDNSGDKQLSLNSAEELTYNSGSVFRAAFQACPEATQDTEFANTGRLVVEPTSDNKCLTIINPSSSNGPWFVKSKTCTSDTKPSAGELWGRGNDFGNVIFWTGKCEPGIQLDSNGNIELASRDRIQFSCNGTYESMHLTQQKS